MLKKLSLSFFVILASGIIGITLSPYFRRVLLSSGIIQEQILIAGTGSMYPTFPKGSGDTDILRSKEVVDWPKMRQYPSGIKLFQWELFPYNISRGDIVEFENEKTKKITSEKYGEVAGFVKRVIAVAGDTLELRDGYVYRNGEVLTEPYTAKPRSTYGGDFLPDCKKILVPASSVFVMGDNRKASLDSRYELGLVQLNDIHYFIPWDKQDIYKKNWRTTEGDFSLAHTATLQGEEFVNLLNQKRREKSLPSLKYDPLLSRASQLRGEAMIKFNDFSVEASKSAMTLSRAIEQSGYFNILSAELFTRGFYEAEELLDNLLEFPDARKILFSKDYQDIGLSAVLGSIDNCPVQIVVVDFGGFVPPKYTKAEIDSWQKLVDDLSRALPTFQNLRNADNINQDTLEKFITLINTRISNAQRILAKMRANQWLTKEERDMSQRDGVLNQEMETLITQIKK